VPNSWRAGLIDDLLCADMNLDPMRKAMADKAEPKQPESAGEHHRWNATASVSDGNNPGSARIRPEGAEQISPGQGDASGASVAVAPGRRSIASHAPCKGETIVAVVCVAHSGLGGLLPPVPRAALRSAAGLICFGPFGAAAPWSAISGMP
jgi:hypothetical protein